MMKDMRGQIYSGVDRSYRCLVAAEVVKPLHTTFSKAPVLGVKSPNLRVCLHSLAGTPSPMRILVSRCPEIMRMLVRTLLAKLKSNEVVFGV